MIYDVSISIIIVLAGALDLTYRILAYSGPLTFFPTLFQAFAMVVRSHCQPILPWIRVLSRPVSLPRSTCDQTSSIASAFGFR